MLKVKPLKLLKRNKKLLGFFSVVAVHCQPGGEPLLVDDPLLAKGHMPPSLR